MCLIEIFKNANFNGKKVLVRVQNNFESIALIIALLKINVDINLTNDEKKVDTKEYDAVLNSDIEHLESYNYFSQYSPNYKFNEKTLNLKSRVALFTSGSTGLPKPIYFNEEDLINKYLVEQNNAGKYFTPTNISCMSGFLRNFIDPILLNKQTYLRTGLFNLDNKQDELNYIEEFYKNVCNYNISNIFITKKKEFLILLL
jgi:acyl-coenzyme A synthetase/AMP-(fatty) acid ligase